MIEIVSFSISTVPTPRYSARATVVTGDSNTTHTRLQVTSYLARLPTSANPSPQGQTRVCVRRIFAHLRASEVHKIRISAWGPRQYLDLFTIFSYSIHFLTACPKKIKKGPFHTCFSIKSKASQGSFFWFSHLRSTTSSSLHNSSPN